MHLEASRTDDFLGADAMDDQRVGDQRAMAAPWNGLRAHEHDSLPRGLFDEGGQTLREFRSLHVVGEPAEGSIAPAHIHGPRMRVTEPSQAGEMLIADSNALQRARERVAVELRVVTRAGHGAGKPMWMQIEDFADQWAFLAKWLQMTPPPIPAQ